MGWWSKVKDVAKSAASVVKKTVQTVVPGGSKGYLEPSKPKPTEAGTLTPTGGAASKRSPSENVERASRGIKDNDVPKKNNSIIDYGKKTISTIGKVLTGEEVGGFKTGLGSTAPYTDPKTGITREVPVLAGTVPITPGAGLASTTPAIKSFLHFSKTYNAAGATGKAGTVVSTAKQQHKQ